MKEKLLMNVEELTASFQLQTIDALTASALATITGLSRNTVSQYLNELYDAGELIKINTRPVFYLHKAMLAERLSVGEQLSDCYRSLAEFQEILPSDFFETADFPGLIGATGSLTQLLEKGRSAIKYPNGGLPVLLLGATGVGKSHIAEGLFEFGLREGVYQKDSRFLAINCSEYADNPEFFLTHLFGYVKGAYTGADHGKEGLVKLANGGVLFLDEVHCLKAESQEKLYHFMDKGSYRIVGDNQQVQQAQVQFIFATSEDPKRHLLRPFLRRIPISLDVPALSVRPESEKKELIHHLFKKEEKRIQRPILLSNNLLKLIMEHDFIGNIGELGNCVKVCTASAYTSALSDPTAELVIDIQHLPDIMIRESASRGALFTLEESKYLSLAEVRMSAASNGPLKNWIDQVVASGDREPLNSDLMKKEFGLFLEAITFDETEQDVQQVLYLSLSQSVFKRLGHRYQFSISNDEVIQFSKLLALMSGEKERIVSLATECRPAFQRLIKEVEGENITCARACEDLLDILKNELNEASNEIIHTAFLLFLQRTMVLDDQRDTKAIILCHGFSTASSLKNTANSMVGAPVFDAIDMPIDVSAKDIADLLSEYLENMPSIRNVIILVDMGSLEIIHKTIDLNRDLNIAVLNNVTIKLALDIGFKLRNGDTPVQILQDIEKRDYQTKHLYFENIKKEKAILVTSSSDLSTAQKMCLLIENSLPEVISLHFVPIDQPSLLTFGRDADVFRTFDVQGIIGSGDPQLPGVEFLSLEELIEDQKLDNIAKVFDRWLPLPQQQRFAQNLLKNFSKDNLFENLTILNPDKIVSYIEIILENLSEKMALPLESRIVVGLYIHISCLVERLLTDKYITTYEELERFQVEHADFIRLVSASFRQLEKDYCVTIPTSEIAYLYDYIYKYQ